MFKRSLATDVLVTERMVVTHELLRPEVEAFLVAIQKELDEIGPTFGMQQRRAELKRRKDELLDRLLELRRAVA
jgi:hypothetical protein